MSTESNGGNLIFLISQPRSGSTLLQLMLSRSVEIATTSEPWIALNPIYALRDGAVDPNYGANQAKPALLEFLKESGVGTEFYKQQVAAFLQNLYSQSVRHQGKTFFLDKTPRYYNIIDDLYEIFPEAKFIVLLRNPLAVLNSVLNTWVKEDDSLLLNNFEDLMIAPFKLVDFLNQNHPACFRVQFEDLVARPGKVMQSLCSFIGIEYTEAMIDYGRQKVPDWKYGDQIGIHQASRPEAASSEKWRTGFQSPREKHLAASYIESLGKPVVQGMGYDYHKLKAAIDPPPGASKCKTISWKTIAKITSNIASIRDVRRIAFKSLMKADALDGDAEAWPPVWQKQLRSEILTIIRPEVEAYQNERARLLEKENRYLAEIGLLHNKMGTMSRKIDYMQGRIDHLRSRIEEIQHTFSWRITAPLRDSKMLKWILDKKRKGKPRKD
jgi:hypothetical protein